MPEHKRYIERKRKGLCGRCGTRKPVFGVLCHRCCISGRVQYRNHYYRNKEQRKCPHCGIDLIEEEKTFCVNCTEQIVLLNGGRN